MMNNLSCSSSMVFRNDSDWSDCLLYNTIQGGSCYSHPLL